MNLTQYTPRINDRDLLDFVNDVTSIINNGRIGIGVTTSAPVTTGIGDGELRLYVNGSQTELYAMYKGTFYGFQSMPTRQSGWGYMQIVAGNPTSQVATVTFPQPFTNVPYILISYIGTSTTNAPTSPSSLTSALTLRSMLAYNVSTTGFTAAIFNTANAGLTSGNYEAFSWLAIST